MRELARRELARRDETRAAGGQAGPPPPDPRGTGLLPSSWEEAKARASDNLTGFQEWSNARVQDVMGDKPSPTRYALALGLQGLNPATAGLVGQEALFDNPAAQQSALMMEENATDVLGPKWGPRLAAYGQSFTQMLPQGLATGAVGAGAGATKAVATAAGALLKQGVVGGLKGAAAGAAENAVMGFLGAREGERASSAIEAAQDPLALALGGLPPVLSGTLGSVRLAGKLHAADLRAYDKQVHAQQVADAANAPAAPASPMAMEPETQAFPVTRTDPVPTQTYAEGFGRLAAEGLEFNDSQPIPLVRGREPVTTSYDAVDLPPEVRDPVLRARAAELSQRVPTIVEDAPGQPALVPAGRTATMNQRVKPLSAEAVADLPSTSIYDTQVVPKTKAAWFRSNGMRQAKTQVDAIPEQLADGTPSGLALRDQLARRPAQPEVLPPEAQPAGRTLDVAKSRALVRTGKPLSIGDRMSLHPTVREEYYRSVGLLQPARVEVLNRSGLPAVRTQRVGQLTPADVTGTHQPMKWKPSDSREISAVIDSPEPLTSALEWDDAAIIQGKPALKSGVGGGSGGKPVEVRPDPKVAAEYARKAEAEYQWREMRDEAPRRDPRTVESGGAAPVAGPLPAYVRTPEIPKEFEQRMMEGFNQRDSWWEKQKKELGLPEFRAQPLVAEAIRGIRAAQHMANQQMGRIFPQLRKAYNAATPSQKRLIDSYMNQNLDRAPGSSGTIPESVLPDEFRNLYRAGMEQMEKQRLDLVKSGYFSEGEMKHMIDLEQRNLQWLHRDYRAFQDKGWRPRKNVMEKAIKYVMSKSDLGYEGARKEIMDLFLGDGDMQQRFKGSNLNRSILKERSGIPPVLREVLGEIKDPAYVVAQSMTEMERLHRQYIHSKAMTAPDLKGQVWDDNPENPAMHEQRIWNDALSPQENKKMFGEFAGKYVAPQLFESVMQGPLAKQATEQLMSGVMSFLTSTMKTGKIAFSPMTYITNWLSNGASGAAAGLPYWHKRFGSRMVQSATALRDYSDTFKTMKSKNNTPPSKDAQWVQWALEDSALIGGTGVEFGGSESRRIVERFLRDPEPGVRGVFDMGAQKFGDMKAKLGSWYDNLDSHWRLAVYIEQVTKGRDRLGLSIPEARARASRIVNKNFASAGSVGNAVKNASRNGVGLLAPFMTWHADNIRVHLNWAKDTAKIKSQGLKATDQRGNVVGGTDLFSGEGAGQALNVGIHYGIVAGVFAGMRRLYNFTDEDVDNAEAKMKGSQKPFSPWREWLPWRDEQGRPQVISLGSLMPSAVFYEGNPEDSLMKRVLVNSFEGFTQGGIAEMGFKNIQAAVGLGDAARQDAPILPGDRLRRLRDEAWKYLQPGFIRDAETIARRTGHYGQLRETEEKLSLPQAIARITPFRLEPAGEKSAIANRRAETSERRDTQRNMQRIQSLPLPYAEKQHLIRASRAKIEELNRKSSQRARDIRRDK